MDHLTDRELQRFLSYARERLDAATETVALLATLVGLIGGDDG